MIKKVTAIQGYFFLTVVLFIMHIGQTHAIDLNYETLSSLEKPIAIHIGDTTVKLNGLIDGSIDANSSDNNTHLIKNFQINADTQLKNSLTIGATYFGFYTSKDTIENGKHYTDNIVAYLSGILGTVSIGDVTGAVHEQTRRNRGAGNANLGYDTTLGKLDNFGVSYIGRYGPSQVSAVIDQIGGTDLGIRFQRPLGNTDYRFSAQYRKSEYINEEATTLNETIFDSNALSLTAQIIYGSTSYDLGIGVESLDSDEFTLYRQYLSTGVITKIGRLSMSAEAHIGSIENQNEYAYALGAHYDIARGISCNLGINRQKAKATRLIDRDITEVLLSLRYRY